MRTKTIQIKKDKETEKAIAAIKEARKNPEFREFIREFVQYHTS